MDKKNDKAEVPKPVQAAGITMWPKKVVLCKCGRETVAGECPNCGYKRCR